MRLAYPVLWTRLGREASQAQTMRTAAALADQGVEVTLIVPRRPADPPLGAAEARDWFGIGSDLDLVQLPSRWAGDALVPSARWLKRLFGDPMLRRFEILYSRAPAMIGAGGVPPIPYATDLYRPWPDQWPFLRPLVRRTGRNPRCLGFVLHSGFAADSYRRAGVPEEKLLVAHNGADPDGLQSRPGRAEARAALGLPPDRPIAVYAGRMNAQKGLDQVLALADLRPGTLFLLVGSEGEGAVEAEAAQRPNVRVIGWQQPQDLPPFLAVADLLLIPASGAPLERHGTCVLPLKTFAYLAAGRPILAPRAPDTAELLRDGENALLVAPDRPAAAAAGLDRLLADAAFAERLAAGAARTAEGLGWDRRGAAIKAFLERRLVAQASE